MEMMNELWRQPWMTVATGLLVLLVVAWLALYQQPSGHDLRAGAAALASARISGSGDAASAGD